MLSLVVDIEKFAMLVADTQGTGHMKEPTHEEDLRCHAVRKASQFQESQCYCIETVVPEKKVILF